MLLEALAYTLVAREISERQARVGFVPDLARDLMPALEIFEFFFMARTLLDEPLGARPADAMTEGEVKPPGHFVHEVVHVRFVAAVVIAREHHARLIVDENPAREVNSLHAPEMTAIE